MDAPKSRLMMIVFELDERSATVPWQAKLVNALAPRFEKIVVVAEKVGSYTPPANVRVVKIPHAAQSVLRPLKAKWVWAALLAKIAIQEKIGCVFIHMNAGWGYRLAPFLKPLRIPIVIWYAHGTVTWRLELAVRAATRMLTSSPEGLRVASPKTRVIGQGVDTELYSLIEERDPNAQTIVVAGRISPRKRCELAIEVMRRLNQEMPELFRLLFIGSGVAKGDDAYLESLRVLVKSYGLQESVNFSGYLEGAEIRKLYEHAFLQLNVSETGSMDKTVLEALSCGVPVLTTNIAYRELFSGQPLLFSDKSGPAVLAERIVRIFQSRNDIKSAELRKLVEGTHDFRSYVDRVEKQLREVIRE